jgi:hypothetical protein
MGTQVTPSEITSHVINDATTPVLPFKVSIVTAMNKHTECIGFLCEALRGHEIRVYLNGTVRYCYIDYFKELYLDIQVKRYSSFRNDKHECIIKLTGYEPIYFQKYHRTLLKLLSGIELPNKTISLIHTIKQQHKYIDGFIKLNPIMRNPAKSETRYMLSAYNGRTGIVKERKIAYIGMITEEALDYDFSNFIYRLNDDYKFIFLIKHHKKEEIMKVRKKLSRYKNVIVYEDMDTIEFIEELVECSYVLIRKKPYQTKELFTGAIALALSHEVPMIIQKEVNVYNIPTLEFKNYYSEMIGLLKSTQTYDYLKLKRKMKDCKEYHIKKNREIVRDIYEKIETDGEKLMKGVMVWEEAATVALEKYKDKIEETTIEDVNVAIKRGMRYRRKMKIYKRMEDARLLEYKMKQARVGKNSEEILKLREKEDMRRIDRLRRRRNRILNIKNNNKRILEEERRKISQSPRKKVVRKLERNMDKISFRFDSSRNRV